MAAPTRLLLLACLSIAGSLLVPVSPVSSRAGEHVSKKTDTVPAFSNHSRLPSSSDTARSAAASVVDHSSRADRAWRMPAGAARDAALDAALSDWTLLDPLSAAEWIAPRLNGPGPLDRALARVVVHTDAAHRPTALAREWAESVCAPELRFSALAHVLREWTGQDESSAFRYAERDAPLSAADRERLLLALLPRERET